MASQASFDISTGADLQEVDNAVNQAMKEVNQRYDFRGTRCTIVLDRGTATIAMEADDAYRMKALDQVLREKLVRRGVPLKNVAAGEDEPASGGRVRREVTLMQGIPGDTAKEIVKAIKGQNLKKVQASIQGDEVRVTSSSKDVLQEVIGFLRSQDFGIELRFGNYRG